SSLHKLIAHCFARAKQSILDCAQWQSGHFGDFLVTEIVRMSQHNQFAVRFGQQTYDAFNFGTTLTSLSLLLGRKAPALNNYFTAFALRSPGKLLAHVIATQMIYGRVVRNLVNPRRKLKFRTITRQRVVDLNK